MIKNYELTILISPVLLQEEALEVPKALVSFIQEKEGQIIGNSDPVKRTLAYPVKKNNQAYFAEIVFSFDPNLIEDLEKKIKENDNVIRHITLVKHPKPKEKIKRTSPSKILEKITARPLEKAVERTFSKKVTLGDIDKKIDEILSE
jgi:small subunit ribosomal protein S6